jgi:hypothetical protein
VLAGVVLVRGAGDVPVEALAARLGWSAVEVEQVRLVLKRHARAARRLVAPAAATDRSAAPMTVSSMREALLTRYGFSSLAADLYLEWLRELVARLQAVPAAEGEVVVFAIDASEGARAKLSEAKLVPVRLSFFTEQDALLGPKGVARTRVSEMKFARIERFAKQARAQGALLTLPDLAVCSACMSTPCGITSRSIRTWWCRRGAACATSAAA